MICNCHATVHWNPDAWTPSDGTCSGCHYPRPKIATLRRWGIRATVKLGTHASQAVWLRPVTGRTIEPGVDVQFRRGKGYGDKWEGPCMVDEIRGELVVMHWR